MGRIKDITGERFGKLVAVKNVGVNKHKRALWLCKCDCGNECVVTSQELNKGDTQSCGCLHKEAITKANKKDMLNKRFGRLVVIEENGKDKNGSIKWRCKCDCGNEITVIGNSLRNGHTKSCDCLKNDSIKELWNNEDYKNRMRQLRIDMNEEMWNDEEKKEQLRTRIQDSWNNEERRKQASKATKQQWQDEDFRNKNSGENHRWFNSELTEEERQKHRTEKGYSKWKQQVKKQANFICDCCGYKGEECDGFMVAHHLENYKNNEDLRLDTNNGVCLCEQCHKEFHKWMGGNKIECTKEDYITFKDAMNTKQVE